LKQKQTEKYERSENLLRTDGGRIAPTQTVPT
jgi:hypothetical protein